MYNLKKNYLLGLYLPIPWLQLSNYNNHVGYMKPDISQATAIPPMKLGGPHSQKQCEP